MTPGAIISVDKPVQWTSFQVVNKLKWHFRRTFGMKKVKIGHAGTLDPLASGLMLVCVGSATKQIEQLQAGIKEYSGTMVIGATTPCYDLEQPVNCLFPYQHVTQQLAEAVSGQFIGEIEQIPPLFSAVKIDGKRAYLSARDGTECTLAPKRVTIHDFRLGSLTTTSGHSAFENSITKNSTLPAPQGQNPHLYLNPQGSVPEGLLEIPFHVTCSKGTYIRSLARDFGLALNSGAFLSSLRRLRIGDYDIRQAIPLDQIEKVVTPQNPLFDIFKTNQ